MNTTWFSRTLVWWPNRDTRRELPPSLTTSWISHLMACLFEVRGSNDLGIITQVINWWHGGCGNYCLMSLALPSSILSYPEWKDLYSLDFDCASWSLAWCCSSSKEERKNKIGMVGAQRFLSSLVWLACLNYPTRQQIFPPNSKNT